MVSCDGERRVDIVKRQARGPWLLGTSSDPSVAADKKTRLHRAAVLTIGYPAQKWARNYELFAGSERDELAWGGRSALRYNALLGFGLWLLLLYLPCTPAV